MDWQSITTSSNMMTSGIDVAKSCIRYCVVEATPSRAVQQFKSVGTPEISEFTVGSISCIGITTGHLEASAPSFVPVYVMFDSLIVSLQVVATRVDVTCKLSLGATVRSFICPLFVDRDF